MDSTIPDPPSPQPRRPDSRSAAGAAQRGPADAPWGREKVRAALGLAVWEVELAVEVGLMRRLPDRRLEAGGVEAALADPAGFRARLAAERRLNATEAAARLGISTQRFARVVKQAGLQPVAEEQVLKYGRVLTVRYWRAADVDTLRLYVGADIALREAATAVGRSEAAQKAARTRARNRERARVARLELDALRPGDQASPVWVLRYAAGLAIGRPKAPSFLRPFAHDPAVGQLAGLVAEGRLREAEHADMVEEVGEQALRAHQAMAGPDEVRRRLGVAPHALAGHAELLEGFVERSVLNGWETDPPEWLLAERAAQAAAEAAHAAHRAQEREHKQVLEAAGRALRVTDEAVAELFGLPVDVITQLRPRSGRWHWQHVAKLRANPPAWLRSETAARAEAAKRRERRAGAKERNARKRAAWRQAWARQMGMPVERVPKRIGKPTPAAIRAAKANPPHWARD